MSAPAMAVGVDLLLASRDHGEKQADVLDQEAGELEERAAAKRVRAAGLRELAAVATRYVGAAPMVGDVIAPRGAVQ